MARAYRRKMRISREVDKTGGEWMRWAAKYHFRAECWRNLPGSLEIPANYMLSNLQTLDERLFLFLNGKHNAFFDFIMYWASNQWIWIPLYCWLVVLLWRRLGKSAYYYYLFIVVLLVLSDQLSSHLIKEWVQRPRPSHVPALTGLVHLSEAGPGGLYGFVSGHAANSFALTIFLALSLPAGYRWLKYGLFAWASLVSYSRVYNGVHYPGDVLGGMLLGVLLAIGFARLFRYFCYLPIWIRRQEAEKTGH
jgi:undecaprenyl-diphosphatase